MAADRLIEDIGVCEEEIYAYVLYSSKLVNSDPTSADLCIHKKC